jgi:c-di-GMP-binding flagellar brake protein YcgR
MAVDESGEERSIDMLPKIGERVAVRLVSQNRELASKEFVTRVADNDPEHIHLEIPISADGTPLRLIPGDRLTVGFRRNGVPHEFRTEVTGFREDAIRLVCVRVPAKEDIVRTERRRFLRVPAMLEVTVRVPDRFHFMTFTVNISGGGFSFVCDPDTPIEVDDIVTGRIRLKYMNGKTELMPFSARVVRFRETEKRKKMVMCNFTDIPEHERQKVIRYCLEQQLKVRGIDRDSGDGI